MSRLSLEGLFSLEDDTAYDGELIEGGPQYTLDEVQEAADVAADQTAIDTTMESLTVLMKHNVSFEGIGANVSDFFKKIWDGIKKFFAWIGEMFKKFWAWLTGLFNKKPDNEELAKIEAAKLKAKADAEILEEWKVTYQNEEKEKQNHLKEWGQNLSSAISRTADKVDLTGVSEFFAKMADDSKKKREEKDLKNQNKLRAERTKDFADADKGTYEIDRSVVTKAYELAAIVKASSVEAKKVTDNNAQTLQKLMEKCQKIIDDAEAENKKADSADSMRRGEIVRFVHAIGKLTTEFRKIVSENSPTELMKAPCFEVMKKVETYLKTANVKPVAKENTDAEIS